MSINFIDKRCTFDVHQVSGGFRFSHQGRTYKRKTEEQVHRFFLETYPEMDTIKLRFKDRKYYLRSMLDEPEIFKSKRQLRSELSQQSDGAWIEEKNGKSRYFIDKGWFFNRPQEVSQKEFEAYQPSYLMQKVTAFVLGALAIGPIVTETARHIPVGPAVATLACARSSPSAGALGLALWRVNSAHAQTPTPTPMVPVTGEFRINTNTTGTQGYPTLTALSGGGFVTTWGGDQTGNFDIYGRRFDAAGIPLGSEFRVNTYTTNDQIYPALAALTGGGFIATWQSFLQDGELNGIYGQIYNATGLPMGSEFRISTFTISDQAYPAVTAMTDGGFVVVWQGYSEDGSGYGVYGQRYNETGFPLGSEFRINTNTLGEQYIPTITTLTNGSFVVAWASNGQDGSGYGVYGQRYNETGFPLGSEFRINTNTTNDQQYPIIESLTGGGFIAAWGSLQNNVYYEIYGQLYDASGIPVGTEFRINANSTGDLYVTYTLTALPGGGFVASWQGYQTGDADIYGQRFDAAGIPVGSEFRINTNTTNNQDYPALESLLGSGFVAAWHGYQTGDADIYSQLFDANGVAVAPGTVIASPSPSPTPIATTFPKSSFIPSSSTRPKTLFSTPISSSMSRFSTQLTSSPTPSPSLRPTLTSSASPYSNSMASRSSILPSSSPSFTPTSTQGSTIQLYILPPVESLVYDQAYPLYFNGQIIGSYTITGGVGPVQDSSSNVVAISLNADIDLPDGTPMELFTVTNTTGTWATTSSFLISTECTQVDSSVTLDSGTPIYVVTTIDLCNPATQHVLVVSILLT